MILHKKISVGGQFAKVGEDIKDGDFIKLLDAGQTVDGEFGARQVFKVETKNGEKNLSFNQTSINNLIDGFGEDTDKWTGKEVKVWIIKAMVSGKLRNVVYLSPTDWIMSDDGEFIPPLQ